MMQGFVLLPLMRASESGNAYAFLSVHRLTGEEVHLERAKAFGGWVSQKLMIGAQSQGGDKPYSLFQGLTGAACLCFDLSTPMASRFPGFEL
ncbi:hypothetical protein AMTR_s00073p00159250 [Amborella trichopoda]|uniref:Uncharacterized protein n=1 Tax=Amborella trichopoda TaxID=13333 RepID=W1NNL4_AMBTC|nr:hypothetical protein AMTR_s00073p00159250 [Amborella trichopoda]